MRQTTYEEVHRVLIDGCRAVVEEIGHRDGDDDMLNAHWARTPERFARYLTHLGRMAEYDRWTTFPATTRHMVKVPGIPFWSACSHHMLPFFGTVTVGYVPKDLIIGLSKIPLLVRSIAQGFWVQEDLTKAISSKLDELLSPAGLGVHVVAQHTCQLLDVGAPIPKMITTELHGFMLHSDTAHREFLEVCAS